MFKTGNLKLSFSTLACPEWTWETIMSKAKEYGYGAIELRGLLYELEIDKMEIFSLENIEDTSRRLEELDLSLISLDTSCDFLSSGDITQTLRSGRAAIELAARTGTPYIRVFGDVIPQDMSEEDAVKIVASALSMLGLHAKEYGVQVLLETHGSFSASRLAMAAVEMADSESVGILWDSANTFEAGEEPEDVWPILKRFVKHVHVKDFFIRGGHSVLCLAGDGEVPIEKTIQLLRKDGYDGWISFEWEKRWVTSLEEPETALPAFVKYIKDIYNNMS